MGLKRPCQHEVFLLLLFENQQGEDLDGLEFANLLEVVLKRVLVLKDPSVRSLFEWACLWLRTGG